MFPEKKFDFQSDAGPIFVETWGEDSLLKRVIISMNLQADDNLNINFGYSFLGSNNLVLQGSLNFFGEQIAFNSSLN